MESRGLREQTEQRAMMVRSQESNFNVFVMQKHYNLKFYDKAVAYITTLNESLRLSKINFGQQVNGGQGELSVKIKSAFDDPPTFAALNNFVKVYCVKNNAGTQTEQLVYSGFVSQVRHVVEGSNQFVEVKMQGLAALLAANLYKSGSSFDVTHTGVDPSTIVLDIISKSNALTGAHFVTTGVQSVGVNITDTFEKLTHSKAMDRALGLAGGGWRWFIGADGNVVFAPTATSADHVFNLQKHINAIEATNSMESIVNDATVGSENATDATSIAAYYKRDQYTSPDSMDATARQQLADSQVADAADPKLLTTIVLNSEFDIESVKPGDTCKVIGLKIGQTVLGDNLLIVSTEYDEQTLRLTIAEKYQDFGQELHRFVASN